MMPLELTNRFRSSAPHLALIRTPLFLPFMACVWVAALPVAARGATPTLAQPSSQAQLHQMYADGQYRACLAQIHSALELGEKAGAAFDAFDLHQLQGECLLRLHEMPEALAAFAAAEKSPNPAQVAQARAIAVLIRRSPKLAYSSRGMGSALDIVDPAARPKAMLALLEDDRNTVQRAVDKAVGESTLVHLRPAYNQVADLHALEFAATGGDERTGPMLDALSQHGRDLVSADLSMRDQKLGEMETLSNQDVVVGFDDDGDAITARRGLTPDEYRSIQGFIQYLANVRVAAEQCRLTDSSCGHDGTTWVELADKAREMAKHAQDVLNVK